MAGIPFSYSVRNLWTRRLTTFLTALGMALVVFVLASSRMLAEGLKKTLVQTGSADNVVVIRKGAPTEVLSGIAREQAAIVESQPEIALGPRGQPLLAREVVVLINLQRRESDRQANVVIRGIGERSMLLRPKVKLAQGRLPRPGTSDIIVGRNIARRFQGSGIGETLRFGLREWTVVGIFDAGNTGFGSEIWGDVDQLMQAFRRPVYSSIIFRLNRISHFQQLKANIETNPRLRLEVRREIEYYAEQSKWMAKFLRVLGTTLTVIFSLGAVIGAIITMYAAVATRTREIGTLRALGFRRTDILSAFLFESLLLGFLGGVAGLFFASFLQFLTISTTNFQTFSELTFSFSLSPRIAYQALAFSLIMGLVGGVLPAFKASRMNIVEALRAG
ncbi:MAG: ABC transporter permease [bacterium]